MKASPSFLLIMLVLILFSCKTENDNTDKIKNTANDYSLEETEKIDSNNLERKKDLELLQDFWIKEKQSIKDENGFPINYRVEEKNPAPVLLAVSDTLSTSETGRGARLQFVKLALQKETYSLFLDGEHIKDVDVVYQVYQLFLGRASNYNTYEVREILDDSGEYANYAVENWEIKEGDIDGQNRLYYSPELHPIERRNEIIGKITYNYVGYASDQTKEEGNRLGEEVIVVVKKAIEKSEIFKYKTLKDIQDIYFG